MTIAEIESTLQTLRIRHPNLDEELLVTLLTSGGWEDKIIKEAVSIFKSSRGNNNTTAKAVDVVLSGVQKVEALPVNVPEKKEVPVVTTGSVAVVLPIPAPSSQSNQKAVSTVSVTEIPKETPPVSPEITYYTPTGEEEANLPTFVDVPTPVRVEEKVIPVPHVDVIAQQPPMVAKAVELTDIQEKKKEQVVAPVVPAKVAPVIEVVKPVVMPITLPQPEVVVIKQEVVVPKVEEPQSLVIPTNEQRVLPQEIAPPENLPLKPFESTPHIWPFSKYKEVFHGDGTLPLPTDERNLVNQITSPVVQKVKKIKIKRSSFDGEDEGLIFLTGTALLIILLLAYMYSNGRF